MQRQRDDKTRRRQTQRLVRGERRSSPDLARAQQRDIDARRCNIVRSGRRRARRQFDRRRAARDFPR